MTDQGKPSLTKLRDFSSGSRGLVEQWVFLYISEILQTPPQGNQPQPHSLSSSMGCSRPLITFEVLCWSLSRMPTALFLESPELHTALWGHQC